jgi:alpha-1,6-mannosyltransferase
MMPSSTKKTLWLLGVLSAAIYGMNFRVGDFLVRLGITNDAPHPISSYLIQIMSLGLIYLLALRVSVRMEKENERHLTPILLFALLFRLPLIPLDSTLSSDIYRYVWEGKVQVVAGMNPYLHPPLDDQLASFRDQEIYPHINRKESPTIYPPGAQLLFATAHWAGFDTPQEFKSLALAAEALTLLLLLFVLRQLRLPLSRIITYAWNPLVIYELFYSGHLESFLLPLLLLFIYLFLRGRVVAAGMALGAATAIKLVPLFLLATLPQGSRSKMFIPFVAVIALTYLFYLEAGTQVLGFLPSYFSDPYEVFNLGLVQLGLLEVVKLASLPASSIRFTLFVLFIGTLIAIAHRPYRSLGALVGKSYLVLSAYLLLSYPAFHPWYLCLLVPLLCLIPSPAWICFSLLLPLSYLKYLAADGTMPVWVILVQFIPLYALLAWEYFRMNALNERKFQWHLGLHTPSSSTL